MENQPTGPTMPNSQPAQPPLPNLNTFNYHSLRARKARFGRVIGHKAIKLLLILIMLISITFAAYLFINHNPLAWLLVGAAIIIYMLLVWQKADLDHLPTGPTDDINDLLSANCLAALKPNPTPRDIAKLTLNTRSGRFMALRFGLAPQLLDAVAQGLPPDPAPIFQTAKEIRRQIGGEVVSGGILAVALIQNHPSAEMILRQMKLDLPDLYQGMTWYNYLHGLVLGASKPRRSGGIARDFSFGYIPLLSRFGQNISEQRLRGIKTQIHQASHQEIVSKMIETFSSGGRQNIALIGPEGSGRTTIVNAFAETLMDADNHLPHNLEFRQVFMLDAAALLSAAPGRGELEGLVMEILGEAYAAKNIIIWLKNAQLFFEEGTGSVDLSNVLQPVLEAGALRIILTLNQQKFLEISARNSLLTNTLNKIMVEPADEADTLKVLEDQAPILEHRYNVVYTYWALKEAYRLSERYVHDLEMPGRALSLLEQSASFAEGGLVLAESVQRAIEKTQGVKLQVADTAEDKDKLLNLEQLIHQRMIDQEGAVSAVANALRRAATGVRNQNRPIGTFLFLGPTGVGKTELAKALSDVYFGGESQVVRIDLNEYVAASDVNRLIADAADNELSLTAQVMKHPFSVVLLDEIEKAHPQVLTTLLQLLDEGILRDINNKEISFRDCIVIATSNAGAERIREYVAQGYQLAQFKEALENEIISSGEFKPEFLNRFDEICIFEPLSQASLLQVVDLIIASVNKTLAPQKITVELDQDAKVLLVERGNDPRLGARPMRRIVQKTVENLLAKYMLSGQVSSGAVVRISKGEIESQLG